ncbi:MAG: SEC-C metal-binding domain-containing protein [Candidatus Aquicultorales bacterium]
MGIIDRLFGRAVSPDINRNDPCWCGSGKKYKTCHEERDKKRAAAKRAAECTRYG